MNTGRCPPTRSRATGASCSEYLFDHVDIEPANIHVPDGTLDRERSVSSARTTSARSSEAGGIDLQILGIGRTGHIGFNEPGSGRESSRTRMITLDKVTRMDAASDFFGEWNVPRSAITMGVGTILEARQVVLMAFGEHKARIVKRAVEGEITQHRRGLFLQQHPKRSFVLDPAAAAELTRLQDALAPRGPIEEFGLRWDERMTKRAVIWLARSLKKPITQAHRRGLQRARPPGSPRSARERLRHQHRGLPLPPEGPSPVAGRQARSRRRCSPRARPATSSPSASWSSAPTPTTTSSAWAARSSASASRGTRSTSPTRPPATSRSGMMMRSGTWISSARVRPAFPQLGTEFADKLEENVENFIARKQPGRPDTPELQKIKG
jgi:glucosamine-6-phosphate deaminase